MTRSVRLTLQDRANRMVISKLKHDDYGNRPSIFHKQQFLTPLLICSEHTTLANPDKTPKSPLHLSASSNTELFTQQSLLLAPDCWVLRDPSLPPHQPRAKLSHHHPAGPCVPTPQCPWKSSFWQEHLLSHQMVLLRNFQGTAR